MTTYAEQVRDIVKNSQAFCLTGGYMSNVDGSQTRFYTGAQVHQTIGDDGRTIITTYAYDDGSQLIGRLDLTTDMVSLFAK